MKYEKLLWFYCFQYFAYFFRMIQVRGPKIESRNKIAGTFQTKKIVEKLYNPKDILKISHYRKIGFGQISDLKI